MYAGITLSKRSGRIVGVHQKIDRVARRELNKFIPKNSFFPSAKNIIHFEGINGPDALKHVNKSEDVPWHFIDPKNIHSSHLLNIISDHMHNLTKALKEDNKERSAFEASWMAHAVVDGLSPPHHYPLDEKIEELWGKPQSKRNSIKDKGLIRGENSIDTISKNWQYWGGGGVMMAHVMFEMGVSSAIAGDKFKKNGPSRNDIIVLEKVGFEIMFLDSLSKIDSLKMYDSYYKNGWTRSLASKTRKELIPEIIKTVVLAWYQALILAEKEK
ncbi:MAG TPA: hypothetical protein PLO25_00360 [Candidatus Saccharibacteria bacterium]|nr:hypothetical protein [Candidatus Saccharibacteria bacterium]